MKSKIAPEYIIAARLADPTTRGQADLNPALDWSTITKLLVKNKIPLISLLNDPLLENSPLMKEVDFVNTAHSELSTWNSLRDEYGVVRQSLLQAGVQTILLKSSGLPPSFPYTSDNLDTLIKSGQIDLVRQIMLDLGYVELRNIEEPQKWLFRKFIGGESVSAIHIHGVVGWGVPFLDDCALWERARVSDDDRLVMIPSPDDAFLITIAHAFYENKAFKLLDIARLRYCLHQGVDFENVENIARTRGWQDGLAFCMLLYSQLETTLYDETLIPEAVLDRAQSFVSTNTSLSRWLQRTLDRNEVRLPFTVSFFFGKIMYYKKVLGDQHRSLTNRYYDVITTFVWGIKHKLQIRGQRGMIIALSGIDGAGKTVHARAMQKAFETSEIGARISWNRFGSSPQKDGNSKYGVKPILPSDISTSLERRREKLRNPFMRVGWLGVNLIIYVLRNTLNVVFPRLLGGVVICDRYIYDAIVEIRATIPKSQRLLRAAEWALTHLCPRPDISWLLDVPAELSISRQPNETQSTANCSELASHQSMLATIASIYGLRVLSTNGRLDETTSQVVRETLLKYYSNYGTLINALLLSNPNQRNPEKGYMK